MKKLLLCIMFLLSFVGFAATTVSADGPAKPVIEGEMPDCYMPIGSDGIILYTNASVPDGGTLKYQWYATDIENMAMIRAIDYAEGDSYKVPEELGVKWYCYAAWNVVGGVESEPTYSRLIRVEFYENSSAHTHSFGEWMITTKPTCTEAGIKTRECDCGVTERAEVPATGHIWDEGTVTREPAPKADGERTYSCLVCKATMTEPVIYSGSLESNNNEKTSGSLESNSVEKSSAAPDEDASTELKENHEENTEQTSSVESNKVSFPRWMIAVIAAVTVALVIVVGILVIALIRKDTAGKE